MGILVKILSAFLIVVATGASANSVEERLRAVIGQFATDAPPELAKVSLQANDFLPRFYEKRGFTPAWFGTGHADDLLAELEKGLAQGFRPPDFHLPLLFDLYEQARAGGPDEVVAFEVVATDAAVRLIHHTIFGKVDPKALDPNWNFNRPIIDQDTAQVVNDYLADKGFSALMALIGIDAPQYRQLVSALELYRQIELDGGWPMVPDGEVIKPDMVLPAVSILRQRLQAEGVSSAPIPQSEDGNGAEIYDTALQEDVARFQARHGLEADGVIGPRTFTALNRTASDRVSQLRLSLERGRWLFRNGDDEYVLVNIAGNRTYLAGRDGSVWTTRSITGSQYRKTPVFRDMIRYMEFNPTWTVPHSIFVKDKLAKIRKDSGYLDRNNYVVRDKSGNLISPASVNWGAKNPGVTLVQKPGPDNALGLVKFMFPNEHAVYLHDTNDHGLFSRNERNLSSGCVRLEEPFEFAMLLMEGDPDWSRQRMQQILESGRTTRVDLVRPMPVMLTYWTAWVEEGDVHFREDIYGRDGPILEALNE